MALIAQEKPVVKQPPYDRKEEIIHDNKRYRIHNNYLTIGGGFLSSSIRDQSERCLGMDFNFHIKRQHFQMGVMMSGPGFGDNNNIQGHAGYGIRKERRTTNFAAVIGPSYHTGVRGSFGTPPVFYQGMGGYVSVQATAKFTYDIGLGIEVFGDVSREQSMYGVKIIAFFSGAYRGPKRNYNPNVRSERAQ